MNRGLSLICGMILSWSHLKGNFLPDAQVNFVGYWMKILWTYILQVHLQEEWTWIVCPVIIQTPSCTLFGYGGVDFYGFACHTSDWRLVCKPYNRPRHATHTHVELPLNCVRARIRFTTPPSFDHTHCGGALWPAWHNFESCLHSEHTNCLSVFSPVQSCSPNAIVSLSAFILHTFLIKT